MHVVLIYTTAPPGIHTYGQQPRRPHYNPGLLMKNTVGSINLTYKLQLYAIIIMQLDQKLTK